jgi:hypothetical protein
MRNYVARIDIGSIMPIITIDSDLDSADDTHVLFWYAFQYVGGPTERSIDWNQEESRIMSVYK